MPNRPRGSMAPTRPRNTCAGTTGRSGSSSSRRPSSSTQASSSRSALESSAPAGSKRKPSNESLAARPPARAARSSTRTSKPRRDKRQAAPRPASPAPITTIRPCRRSMLAAGRRRAGARAAGSRRASVSNGRYATAALRERDGERILREGDIGRQRATQIGDAAVADVHERALLDGRRGRPRCVRACRSPFRSRRAGFGWAPAMRQRPSS